MKLLLRGLLLLLLQFFCPAAVFKTARVIQQDPAYSIYEAYRYAYDTYGYLFLSEDKEEDGGEKETVLSQEHTEEITSKTILAKLQDYDYLMRHFYSVHASTTADRNVMKAEEFLAAEMELEKDGEEPQILIYHTHSQETYADYGPEHKEATIVQCGAYLAELLRDRGWNVIHDTSAYDMREGKLERSNAYTYALEGITQILDEHPSIQVILDLHRDGVQGNLHLATEIDGKKTAKLMLFQGMCRTPDGPISYLPNPYLKENLAFSFQIQLEASRYPELMRKIYLKGLRYNLHLRPRSALIEVGAQTNTSQEAKNAMEPLAEVLDAVLQGKKKNDILG